MKTLLATIRPLPGERARLALAVGLAAAASGAAIALLATSGYLISRAAQRPLIISLMVTITAVRAFGLARAAFRYAERLASHDFALRQLARLRTRFYARLAPLVPGRLPGHDRGDLLARFVSDVDTLKDSYLRVIIPWLLAAAVIAGAGLAACLMLPAAGAALVGTLGITAVLSTWASATVEASNGRRQAAARAKLTGQLVEAVDGSAELALAGRGPEYVRRLDHSSAALDRLARRDAVAGSVASGLGALVSSFGLLLLLLIAIAGVRAGALPGVLLATVAFLFLGARESVLPLPGTARRLRACTAAASRLEDVCDHAPPIADPPAPESVPAAGPLAVEELTFAYSSGAPAVLDRLELRVGEAEHVALVGPSGAGKTTLAELLVRFLDPDAGQVTIGGVDVRRLGQADLRRVVLLCDQDAYLFNTTIRENLLIGRRDAHDAALWTALSVVGLDAWAASLPDGLDTIVGQQGELVSGGERHRIAVARALLSDARFLILDEPTAQLDAPLARAVMRRLLDHTAGRGLLVITHATSDLDGFDRVLELERGQLRSLVD